MNDERNEIEIIEIWPKLFVVTREKHFGMEIFLKKMSVHGLRGMG